MDDALTLLRLQLEWGADEAIAPDPLDRFRAAEPRPPGLQPIGQSEPQSASQSAIARPPPGTPPSGPGEMVRPVVPAVAEPGSAAERALGLAGRAATLDELRAALAAFDGCALRDTASNLVFAEGDPAATTLVIGEPPGREEDRSGHPFAGPEGALLDQMLASIGLARAELMLTPLLPWRPPGGRPVNAGELAVCLPFLNRLIVLLQPRRLVIFGGTAVRALLMPPGARRRPAPGWIEARTPGLPPSASLPALALPGMAEMLKNPPVRRDAWAGLRLLRRALNAEPTQT